MSHPRARTALVVLVVLSIGWFAWSVLTTSQGKVTALTANRGNLFRTGTIDIDTDAPAQLLFDVDGLYPGTVLESCITVSYVGSIPGIGVRLHARMAGGTGLETFVLTSVQLGRGGGDGSCAGFTPARSMFDGTLAELAAAHPDYDDGAELWADAQPGDQAVVRVTAQLADDNAAQGLTTDFFVTVEARP